MLRAVLVVPLAWLAFVGIATAQIATYADVKAQAGVRVDGAELKQLMPNAKVLSRTQAGSTRSWQNNADGTFTATSDGRGSSGGSNSYATAAGTWRVNESGQLCVAIKWPRNPDDWCRTMFRVGSKYYGVARLEDNAPASEFEFTK